MLRLENIGKDFFGVAALSNVTMDIRPGEVLAVIGENGAGKSTFIKIACGIYQPSRGRILLDGQEVRMAGHADAIAKGISLVSQEIQIVPDATVAENVMLDKLARYKRFGRLDWQAMNKDAGEYIRQVDLSVSPAELCRSLSAGQKQLIQIAKSLSAKARILFLDEPTSSITSHEAGHLFNLVGQLKKQGVAIVFVSHKLDEVFQLSDRVVVLRDGLWVGEDAIENLNRNRVISMMIGHDFHEERFGRLAYDENAVILAVDGLSKPGLAEDISFELKQGEILGFYGLVGSGRTETARMLIGDLRPERGEIRLKNKPVHIHTVAEALHTHHIGYISENRKETGLILDASVGINLTLPILEKLRRKITRRIDVKSEDKHSRDTVEALSIKTTGIRQAVKFLSGGNQQKVSIGKWLVADCDILIFDEPTVGVDVGSKAFIHDLLFNLARDQKKSIILISSDLAEMAKIARRVLVFREGKIVGEVNNINNDGMTTEEVSKRIGDILI